MDCVDGEIARLEGHGGPRPDRQEDAGDLQSGAPRSPTNDPSSAAASAPLGILILLCHKFCRWGRGCVALWQHGHRDVRSASAMVRRRRMVATVPSRSAISASASKIGIGYSSSSRRSLGGQDFTVSVAIRLSLIRTVPSETWLELEAA
jgi:hypothetical protein